MLKLFNFVTSRGTQTQFLAKQIGVDGFFSLSLTILRSLVWVTGQKGFGDSFVMVHTE